MVFNQLRIPPIAITLIVVSGIVGLVTLIKMGILLWAEMRDK